MKHVFYSYGDEKKISWAIQTDKNRLEQTRRHPDIYFDKVTIMQSKYISLHVGLFWGIGMFAIKDKDHMTIKLDNKPMYEHLILNKKHQDEFIENRTKFIRQLILQRRLEIQFELISEKENLAKALI